MYRPFVTCDDPKGVVECRPFRKSKNNSKRLEDKVENRRVSTNLNPSKEEGKTMVFKNAPQDLQNPSSLQLMEVSKGAHKLNQLIDSWSQGMTFGGNSKDIAEDLLKGALDLQDSLIMLGKLQEASQVLKKKPKERSSGERLKENQIERVKSDRFADHNYQKGFQKHRCSVDGSSRDCYEELRTAIRDGLAKQNLLPPNSAAKRAYSDKRTFFSDPDIASTSSSQSSMVNFQSSASSDSSQSSKALQTSRESNLIAKLMGLEEIPLESERIFSQRRPVVDSDMPKARKPQPFAYAVEKEPRKLTEIFETMQHKGLMRSKSSEGLDFQSHHSDIYNSRRRNSEDAPPIVLIRPLTFSSMEGEENHLQELIHDMGALNTNEVLRKLKMKQLQPKTNFSENALNSDNMLRRFKREESPIRRSGAGANNSKEMQAKPEESIVKSVKVNDKLSSNKLKPSVPVNQQEKKKIIEKKVDVIQKVTPRGKKPAEMENLKSKAVSKSHDQAKVISTKERKPAIRPLITKSSKPQQKSTSSSSTIMKPAMPATSHSHKDEKSNLNNAKSVEESLVADPTVKVAAASNSVNKLIDFGPANESDLLRTSAEAADQPLIEEGADASEILIKEQCDCSQNSLCNGTTQAQTTQQESYSKSSGEAEHLISNHTSKKRCFGIKSIARDLFLSSPSFFSYAEELFHIDSNQAMMLQTTASLNDSEIANSRLLFDCATELMQHKSLCRHPLLLGSAKILKPSISLARLVDEVCNGIEILESCSRPGPDELGDSLNAILKRDLMCKRLSGGGWESGWTHGFSIDEVEQIVGEIGKLLLKALIGDLLTDFLT